MASRKTTRTPAKKRRTTTTAVVPAKPSPRVKTKLRKVASMSSHHILRGNDGKIVAHVRVQSEHIFYALAEAKVWRRVSIKQFAAFMETVGDHVKSDDGD